MALTYVTIATVTVGSGGAANMEFTNIPGTYTDLVVRLSGRTNHTDRDSAIIRFNGSTSNYSQRRLTGDGSTASSNSSTTSIRAVTGDNGATANTFGNTEYYIPNYTSSNNKSVSIDGVGENNATSSEQNLVAGLWSDSASITTITLLPINGTLFMQYSTATLYGIKNTV